MAQPPLSSGPRPAVGGATGAPGAQGGLPAKKGEIEIVTIPEKFYGVALGLNIKTEAESATPLPPPKPVASPAPKPASVLPPERRKRWPVLLAVFGMVLLIGGGFVYLNRALLFKPPTPVIRTPPTPVVVIPAQPSSLTATSTSPQSVSLSWLDTSNNEDGFRIERRESDGTFLPVTNLPSGSEAFLDPSVQAERTYAYRVVAMNSAGESAPSNEVMVQTPAQGAVITPTPTLPPGGLDSDSDGLSDVEEPLFGTDLHNPDTDADGFLDGNEVFHLYNPSAQAPVRLLESGLVKEASGSIGWAFYIPSSWSTSLDVADGSRAHITTGRPESFEIIVEDNPRQLGVREWYREKFPTASDSLLRTITTKGGLQGLMGPDRLDVYFPWGERIFVIRYDLGGQSFINERTTFEMMLNSLRLPGAPKASTPPPSLLEGPGAFVTSTASETEPNPVPETATSTETTTSSTF